LNENFAEAIVRGPGNYENAGLSPDGSWILYLESTPIAWRFMRRLVAGGSPEMVLEERRGVMQGYVCPPMPGARCVLADFEEKDLVFYSLDLFRGKGERVGVIGAATDWPSWGISPDGSRVALVRYKKLNGSIEVLTISDHTWHEISVEPG